MWAGVQKSFNVHEPCDRWSLNASWLILNPCPLYQVNGVATATQFGMRAVLNGFCKSVQVTLGVQVSLCLLGLSHPVFSSCTAGACMDWCCMTGSPELERQRKLLAAGCLSCAHITMAWLIGLSALGLGVMQNIVLYHAIPGAADSGLPVCYVRHSLRASWAFLSVICLMRRPCFCTSCQLSTAELLTVRNGVRNLVALWSLWGLKMRQLSQFLSIFGGHLGLCEALQWCVPAKGYVRYVFSLSWWGSAAVNSFGFQAGLRLLKSWVPFVCHAVATRPCAV